VTSVLVLVVVAIAVIVAIAASHSESPVTTPGTAFPAPSQAAGNRYQLKAIEQGAATAWRLPVPLAAPRGLVVGADGRIWITEQDKVTVDAFSAGSLTRYIVDPAGAGAGAFSLTQGPQGTVWFSGYPAGTVGRIFTDGRMNVFQAPLSVTSTLGVAEGPANVMWLTDLQGGSIVRVAPDAKVTQVRVPVPAGAKTVTPRDIVQGPDHNMWFTDPSTDSIGEVTTGSSVTVHETLVARGAQPRSIAAGADGTLWATLPTLRALAKIDPATGISTVIQIHGVTEDLNALAVAPDGSLWVSGTGPWIYHVGADGSLIQRYRLPAKAGYADEIAIDPSGRVWTVATDANLIVSIAP
jgi:virginiamycin B lyase